MAPRAEFRERLGWHCPLGVSRVRADITGDGVPERIVLFDRSHRGARCDEFEPPKGWHLAVFLRGGDRIDRRVFCLSAAFCRLRAVDYDRDHVSELEVQFDGGAASVFVRPFRFDHGVLRRIRVRTSALGLARGPLDLGWGFATTFHNGWVCRDRRDGSRVLLRFVSRWHEHTARWRTSVARVRFDEPAFRVIGSRSFVSPDEPGAFPNLPNTRSCGRRST